MITNRTNEQFRYAMFLLPMNCYDTYRVEITKRCKVTRNVYNNWISGRTEIPELAKPIIEEIFGKKIFQDDEQTQESNDNSTTKS